MKTMKVQPRAKRFFLIVEHRQHHKQLKMLLRMLNMTKKDVYKKLDSVHSEFVPGTEAAELDKVAHIIYKNAMKKAGKK